MSETDHNPPSGFEFGFTGEPKVAGVHAGGVAYTVDVGAKPGGDGEAADGDGDEGEGAGGESASAVADGDVMAAIHYKEAVEGVAALKTR